MDDSVEDDSVIHDTAILDTFSLPCPEPCVKQGLLVKHGGSDFAFNGILSVIFVIRVVFFMHVAYNKNVIMMHNNSRKSVKESIYGTIDFE